MRSSTIAGITRPAHFSGAPFAIICAIAAFTLPAFAHEGPFPEGFDEVPIYSGFYLPTAVRFAPDGHVFITEKYGKLHCFDGLNDTTDTIVKDFEQEEWTFHDHGLLGLAVDPQWPTRPYVYVMYAKRGSPGARISRIQIDPVTDQMVGNEVVLVEGWCLIYPSHGVGDLVFGPDGALYASVGDGASFNYADWGQDEPYNADNSPDGPCTCSDPLMEGGALRAQDLRTSGDPAGYDGAIIRIDPDTGAALPTNPLYGGDTSDDRIIAYGLRNPFRFAIDKLTGSIFVGDVGWNTWEELNYIPDPLATPIKNFGWPCYEGPDIQPTYYYSDIPICNSLVADGTATPPFYTYQHVNGASITGAAFYEGGTYPAKYTGALFIADYSEHNMRVMYPNAQGVPDPATVEFFAAQDINPVDLQVGPDGDLYYIDIDMGSLRRIQYTGIIDPPVAVASADVTSGPSPLTVQFSALNSSDPNNSALTYGWDFNNDGDFGDSTGAEPVYTFQSSGNYPVNLKVTNAELQTDIDTIVISVDNGPPTATITAPDPSYLWRAGDHIPFAGSADDPDTGPIDASGLSWSFVLNHCVSLDPPNCHEHFMESYNGVGSGTFLAIDHEYPCSITVLLTATEPGVNGLTDSEEITLYPEVSTITVASQPVGRNVGIYAELDPSPVVRQAVVLGTTSLTAPTPQIAGDTKYSFVSWSDGGAAVHGITIPATDTTYTATFSENQRPNLGTIGNQSGSEGSVLQFDVSATDPDGTTPVLVGSNLPAGATLVDHHDGTATFHWIPAYTQSGTYSNINIRAVDFADSSWFDVETITITVGDLNPAPVVAAVGDQSIDEAQSLRVDVSATDPDGSVPTLSVFNAPQGSAFTDHHNGTGTLTWTTGYFDAGTYPNVTIVATDAIDSGLTDDATFKITVANVNRKPVIGPVNDVSANEGGTVNFTVTATDPDLNYPALGATGLPSDATFTDHGNGTGTFTWPVGFAAAAGSPYIIHFSASDGIDSVLASCTIDIDNVNQPVVLEPIGNKAIAEGETLSFVVTATDPDGLSNLVATGLPDGAQFAETPTGTFMFYWTPGFAASGNSPYHVTFSATDGQFTDSETIAIDVTKATAPGEILVVKPSSGSIWARKGTKKSRIKWTSTGEVGSKVRIELWRNGQFALRIKGGCKNDGAYGWDIPNDLPAGGGYVVRVISKDNPLIVGDSGSFTILNKKKKA